MRTVCAKHGIAAVQTSGEASTSVHDGVHESQFSDFPSKQPWEGWWDVASPSTRQLPKRGKRGNPRLRTRAGGKRFPSSPTPAPHSHLCASLPPPQHCVCVCVCVCVCPLTTRAPLAAGSSTPPSCCGPVSTRKRALCVFLCVSKCVHVYMCSYMCVCVCVSAAHLEHQAVGRQQPRQTGVGGLAVTTEGHLVASQAGGGGRVGGLGGGRGVARMFGKAVQEGEVVEAEEGSGGWKTGDAPWGCTAAERAWSRPLLCARNNNTAPHCPTAPLTMPLTGRSPAATSIAFLASAPPSPPPPPPPPPAAAAAPPAASTCTCCLISSPASNTSIHWAAAPPARANLRTNQRQEPSLPAGSSAWMAMPARGICTCGTSVHWPGSSNKRNDVCGMVAKEGPHVSTPLPSPPLPSPPCPPAPPPPAHRPGRQGAAPASPRCTTCRRAGPGRGGGLGVAKIGTEKCSEVEGGLAVWGWGWGLQSYE